MLIWGEAVHGYSNRRCLGSKPRPGTRESIVVLGYRNHTEHANLVNRYRLRAGILSQGDGVHSILVFNGGSVGARVPDAEVMAHYARGRLDYDGELVIKAESRSTWESIRNFYLERCVENLF